MEQRRTNARDAQPSERGAAHSTRDPAEEARRELIQWCQRHGLPVPPERQVMNANPRPRR